MHREACRVVGRGVTGREGGQTLCVLGAWRSRNCGHSSQPGGCRTCAQPHSSAALRPGVPILWLLCLPLSLPPPHTDFLYLQGNLLSCCLHFVRSKQPAFVAEWEAENSRTEVKLTRGGGAAFPGLPSAPACLEAGSHPPPGMKGLRRCCTVGEMAGFWLPGWRARSLWL